MSHCNPPMTQVEWIIEQVAKIVKEKMNGDYRLFLFGSRANDTCDERADIDIGILSDRPLSTEQMYTIKEEIDEIPTLLKIDFVDLTAASDGFRTTALKRAKEITG